MNDFCLSGPERVKMENLLEYAYDSRLILRAYALLWLDDGESISEVATRLSVTRQTVYNWCNRFQARSMQEFIARLTDEERSGRPKTATDEVVTQLIASVIESDPRDFQYRSTVWTAPLLVQYLWDEEKIPVSDDSVRRVIARLKIKWKRPRHSLALRSEKWRQAKGG
jgi:transposase